MTRLAVGLIILSLAGCVTAAQQTEAARVRVLTPQPLVAVPPGLAVAFSLDSSVPDQFVIPEQNGITPVPVESWRMSLTNGFQASFAPSQSPTIVVQLKVARLDYVPAGQTAQGGNVVTRTAVARIKYVVAFTDAGGQQLDAMTGEVLSTQPWMEMGGSSSTATEAIEMMYARISERLGHIKIEAPAPAATATAI